MAFADFGIETPMEFIRMHKGKSQTAQALKPESPLLYSRSPMDTRHRQCRYSNPAKV
jgi:hypothetical protein